MKPPIRKRLFRFFSLLLLIFVGIQFIHPEIKNSVVVPVINEPENVKQIFKRACFDCHSGQTDLRWFDKIAPASWLVASHIKEGREGLNFSEWQNMASAEQKAKLWEAVNQISSGDMPLKSYEFIHPEAKVSIAELATLKGYLLSMVKNNQTPDTAKKNELSIQYRNLRSSPTVVIPKSLNGIAYNADYKNWQPISTTERFDNGTLRVILGNPTAIQAIAHGQVNPWPNGTVFAKVAWDQLMDSDGEIHTGAFRQIEYMIKNDKKYADTKGWGFARFKTLKMIPYGKTAMFTTECVNCHRPMKDNDFVFTQPVKF